MGVVYHSNYMVWFEVARTELLRKLGHPYKGIEEETGLYLVVAEAKCRYRQPARYDDIVEVSCSITKLGGSSITFSYRVKKDNVLLTEGKTIHVFTDISGKPKRMPSTLREVLKQ